MEKCPKCQSTVKVVPSGISKKSGKPYNAFVSCNSRDCDFTAPYTEPEPVIQVEDYPGTKETYGTGEPAPDFLQPSDDKTAESILLEEVQKINGRLDKLIQYITTKLK